MTWGAMVDTRRALVTFFLVMLVVLLSMFMCAFVLVKGNILTANSLSPSYPASTTVSP